MANHVYTTINITGNKEVMEKLEEIKIKVEENNEDNYLALAKGFFETIENDRNWFGENIGAKWCYHDDFWVDIEGEVAELMTVSAWYPPLDLVKHIYNICAEIDPECEVDGDYEDESYTPIGGFVINKNGFQHEEEDDLEYPDEEEYLNEEGEINYDEYDVAVEEFYERVSNLRGEMKSLAHSNLREQVESVTTDN